MPERDPRQPTRRRKRTAAMILLLVGGAVVNVVVAWGVSAADFTNGWTWRVGVGGLDDSHIWQAMRSERRGQLRIRANTGFTLIGEWDDRWEDPYALLEPWSRVPSENDVGLHIYEWQESATGWPRLSFWSRLNILDPLHSFVSTPQPIVLPRDVLEHGLLIEHSYLPRQYVLPTGILWTGLIVNTLFYALLLWLLILTPLIARTMLRRRRGLCAKCAYPVGVSAVCTECGAAVTRKIEQ